MVAEVAVALAQLLVLAVPVVEVLVR